MLERDGTSEVVASSGTAEEGLRSILEHTPDVAVIDISLPDHDGIWLAREVRRAGLKTPLLVLSMHGERKVVLQALEAGVNGYVTKSSAAGTLLKAIQTVLDGDSFLEAGVANFLLEALREKSGLSQLADRDTEILQLVADGMSNQAISETLHISKGTVKSRLTSIFRQLKVSSRAGAVATAIERGLISQT